MKATLRPTVIVADDDLAILMLFSKALERAGYDVLQAPDGGTALRLAHNGPVDLLVVDLDMPGVSGLDVIAGLRQQPETAMLPIIIVTGTGDETGVVDGLDAGADDFLTKPVRLEELVARVRARLRVDDAWTRTVEADLRSRATVVSALGHMAIADDSVALAEDVVREIGKWSDLDLVVVLEVVEGQHLRQLAAFTRTAGHVPPGLNVTPAEATRLLSRTLGGPWVERIDASTSFVGSGFVEHGVAALAVAPIHSLDRLTWILVLGKTPAAGFATRTDLARLLGSAIDYASVLGVAVRSSVGARRDVEATQARLRGILQWQAFHPVFQPIVELPSRAIVGYEALTRFADGVAPLERFLEAAEVGMGFEFEIATARAAIAAAVDLPSDAFLALNVSPSLVIEANQLTRAISGAGRPIVIELTEHEMIEDYSALRSAMFKIPNVRYAVDDAGAGYASFRHILELAPQYAKLDRTIIRAIEHDAMRQALVAGLDYYAVRTRCELIAEGVETEAEAQELLALGIHLAQGHLFGEPSVASANQPVVAESGS